MSEIQKNMYIARLFDCYGELLSDKQKLVIDCYYNQDFSLSEIAENEGITRQGVSDAIKRAEAFLLEAEEKLGFCKKFDELKKLADNIDDFKMLEQLRACIENL